MTVEQKVIKVFDLILNGFSFSHACRAADINSATYIKTIAMNQKLQELYQQFNLMRAELAAEKVDEIAETEEDTTRAKLKIDAIKWANSKRSPEKYGDNVNIKIEKNISITDAIAEARQRVINNENDSQHALPTPAQHSLPSLEDDE